MDIQISELRLDDLPTVRELFAEADFKAYRNTRELNLVAKAGDTIVAAILCAQSKEGYQCRLVYAAGQEDAASKKALVDKALLRLKSNGIRKCHIVLDDEFFTGVRWQSGAGTAQEASPPAEASPNDADAAATKKVAAPPVS